MTNANEDQINKRRGNQEYTLTLDDVVATQPELGPSIPDGGFGWVVFLGTLFFQALIPCLIVNFGIFLAFSKLAIGTHEDKNIRLWDDKLLFVPLFFSISRNFFDSTARYLSLTTRTPRLNSVVGTCLTCAGLLFMWMGMTGNNDKWLYVPAGLLSGMGATIVLVQCETLMSQYFRMKLPILNQISLCVVTMGFLIAPVVLGQHMLQTSLTQVLLWYQAIILQGLVVSLVFRKPLYLKSKKISKPYQFVLQSSPDDEEDILSKNSRELQIKRHTNTKTHVSKITINQHQNQPGTSATTIDNNQQEVSAVIERQDQDKENRNQNKKWDTFEEDEEIKYAKLDEWELFDDDENDLKEKPKKQNWERFDDDEPPSPQIVNNLSFADEIKIHEKNNLPSPLFSDLPVNNNNTYAYDDEIVAESVNSNVFMPNNNENVSSRRRLELLKQPTFYKSLLMIIANTYSSFVFYALYPSYLFIIVDSINIKQMTGLVGAFSLVNLIFLCVVYWIYIDKDKRAICLWFFYWVECVGYFMIADFQQEYLILVGGVLVTLSIGALDHLGKPVLGIPIKGGISNENSVLTVFSGISLLLFVFLDISFKTCFRLVAIIHFFTGSLWLANFAYKRLRNT